MEKSSSKNIADEFENLREKLLDLTLRNQLLNFKPRSKTIEVINQSPSSVYQALILQKKKMQFVPIKKENDDENKSRFSSLWEHPPIDLSMFSEGDKSLKTDLSSKELQKKLFYINQQSKTMLQEQGYNILYLALGFLEWNNDIKPNEIHAAPLILIPVSIERKKVGKSFSICWNGEDLQTNISLQAKLLNEGIELPEFKLTSYIEGVEHYLKDVKNSVSKMKDWNVSNHISLGFFSFTKFVMYNDLNPESWEDNVDLTKHELIEAIFNPSKNNNQDSFNADDIDKKLHYKDMYHVLDADSSQISAIEDVKAGKNLVVEGPPGTGKSQTIVNLIAELLASGKSVLFVSEKMAALEVVKNRLDNVGLGKFVLELHSHKTRRKKFLKNLQNALNVRSIDELHIDQVIRKLESLKIQLDDYAEIIHKPMYKSELSPFQLYGMKESADDHFSRKKAIIPLIRFESPEKITVKDLDDMIIELENLAELYRTISKNNPWSYCNPKSLLPGDLREIELLLNDTSISLKEFNQEAEHIYDSFGIKVPNNLKSYEKSLEALNLLEEKNINLIDSSILTNKDWSKDSKKANELIENLGNYQKNSKIMDRFNDNILNEDLDHLIKEITKSVNKKFKLFGGNSYKESVEDFYKVDVPSDKKVLKDLKQVKEFIKIKNQLNKNENIGMDLFGELWHLDASIKDLKSVYDWMGKFNQFIKEKIFSKKTIEILSNEIISLDIQYELKDYISRGNSFRDNLKKLESKLKPRSKLIFKKESDNVSFDKWELQINTWIGQLSSLHLWSQYLNTKNSCLNKPSSLFIKTIEKKDIEKEDIKFLVYGNFADSLLNLIFSENDALATFIGELHQNRISEFKQLDSKIIELNRKRIFQKLNNNIPKVFGEVENPEAKILAGEFTRKRGHLSVRKLLEKSGGIIKQIKPCFMMSPLSIAQYLDPTTSKLQFDVVIFDEASQVKPEDALGAFMRAKNAVVMGDTQQLPPTSFFDQIIAGESEEEATALDMESILHLCKLSFPVKMLKWHYRSRHESLISVSNREFYNDELLVYPSPSHNTNSLGLKLKYNPNNYYDRGKTASNREEAKEVVKEIFKHFNKFGDTKSLGVGTFSVSQRNAILEELEIERKQHPELEPLFSDKKKERFFVKNLETIQGDERDVILISIGYGFDDKNKISLNFGPLNQDGGERRLNVLITRAREKCLVFSNFKSQDMVLSNNPPFGVKALKEFLEYAENLNNGKIEKKPEEEPFEDAVYSFLVEAGYDVDKQIGCAGFRVDLAIVDKEDSGKYILGIECDGKMYSSSKVARDRDRLREQILNGLGWNLYHLWSTDWYRNRELTREKLINYIESVKAKAIIEEETLVDENQEDDGLIIVDPIEDDDFNSADEDIEVFNSSQDNLNKDTQITNNSQDNLNENTEKITFESDNLEDSFNPENSIKNKIAIENEENIDSIDDISNNDFSYSNNLDSNENDNDYDENDKDFDEFKSNISDEMISDINNKFENSLDPEYPLNDDDNNNSSAIEYIEENEFDVLSNSSNDKKENIKNDIDLELEKTENNNDSIDLEDNFIDKNNESFVEKEHHKNSSLNIESDDMKEKITDETLNQYTNSDKSNNDEKELSSINSIETDDDFKYEDDEINNKIFNQNNDNDVLKQKSNDEINNDLDNKNLEDIKNNFNNNIELKKDFENNIPLNDEKYKNLKNENDELLTHNDKKEKIKFRSHINLNFEDIENENQVIEEEKSFIEDNDDFDFESENQAIEEKKSLVENNDDFESENEKIADDYINNNLDDENSYNTEFNSNHQNNDMSNSYNDKILPDDLVSEDNDQSVQNKIELVSKSISEIKNEMEHINNSLKEIENIAFPKKINTPYYYKKNKDYIKNSLIDENNTDNINKLNNMKIANDNEKNSDLNINDEIQETIESFDMDEKSNSLDDDRLNKVKSNSYEDNTGFEDPIISDIDNLENLNDSIDTNEYNEEHAIPPTIKNQDKLKTDTNHEKNESIKNQNELKIDISPKENLDIYQGKEINDFIVDYTYANIDLNSSDSLYGSSIDTVAVAVDEVVFTEGPIHIDDVISRIKNSCNIKRAGNKVKNIISQAISYSEHKGSIIVIDDFLFQNNWSNIQVKKRNKPNIDLISNEEIEENIKLVTFFKEPIYLNELTKLVAKNFGFKSTSQKTAKKINSVVDYMLANEILINLNDKIQFNN